MKWRRSPGFGCLAVLGPLLLLLLPGFWARADWTEWARNLEAGSRLEKVLVRFFPVAGTMVPARRPPEEARAALSQLIAATPADAELYALRAAQAEQQLDFVSAEADWKRYARFTGNPSAGQMALADFYHRRLRPREEVAALLEAARTAKPAADRFIPAASQAAWRAYQRILAVIEAQALPAAQTRATYEAWRARYPRERVVYAKFLEFLLVQEDYTAAEALLASYQQAFPEDSVFPVKVRASIEQHRGSAEQAVAVYDHAFLPLWSPELVQEYFTLLRQSRQLPNFLDRTRVALAANPVHLGAAARLFYYHQQQGNLGPAQQALVDYRQAKEARQNPWSADELYTLARLFEAVHNYNEAARYYYALYSLPGAEATAAEQGLVGLTNLLLAAPEQPIQFGAAELSFYRDVATLDPGPGFLNGILSLLFNSQNPAHNYATQDSASMAYFHRARAAELVALVDQRFPRSTERPELHAKLLEAVATYGDAEGIVRGATRFLAEFPQAPQRTRVALLLADSFARQGKVQEELATYDRLLEELAARADGMPIGPPGSLDDSGQQSSRERSPDYARVLDRTITRLVSMKRLQDALALYRREIDHNPDDPGLYERLAVFLEQNRLGAEVEQVYRLALQRFPDRSWHHRLARWYLRERRQADFEKLSRQVIEVFSGSELDTYFREVVNRGGLDAQLYLQLNLYAHRRFPHNLAFVRNLLAAYQRKGTENPAAREHLLRRYWFLADDLRSRFFEFLSRQARLQPEAEAVRASLPDAGAGRWPALVKANPAAARFLAESELWQSHYETAGPVIQALAVAYPGDTEFGQRAADLHRSLGWDDSKASETAVLIQENLHRFQPRDAATLTRLGEIYAERELVDRARPYWNRIARIEPGKPDGYLEAATVFWDYFQFDDALRLIGESRKKLSNPALFAYEAGAIYENKRDPARAVEEYMRGALATPGESPARRRLLRLARRPASRSLVEEATTAAALGENPPLPAVTLRVAVLEEETRRPELESFLLRLTKAASSWELLGEIDAVASRLGFDQVKEESLRRQIALAAHPVDRLRLRLALAGFYESRGDFESARFLLEELYAENPTILGVVRATADFYWRHKMRDPALEVLLQAAAVSHPELQKQFTFEAARKATDAAQYERARRLLASLREQEPFRQDYLAAEADTYAREGNDAGLRDFSLATIEALGKAPLSRDEKTARTAALRRGLIPALTRLKQPEAAVDQYIEIINRFPEDESLVQEAASYAERRGLQARLRQYYAKTSADSPRDFRWPMVLARLETYFEHLPEAIAAYSRATEIRPDRVDFHTARASLEVRLMRFDEALRSYEQLYNLTYQDPRWMENTAEILARQGRMDPAVEALRKALLQGRPEKAENYFAMARRLLEWNQPEAARPFSERGVELAGREFLGNAAYAAGAQDYARILTLLRRYETAYERLRAAQGAAPDSFRRSTLPSALQAMGEVVDAYFTPEEKAAFAYFLEEQSVGMAPEELSRTLLPLAQQAGLAELEVRWRLNLMMGRPGPGWAEPHLQRLQELERRRMRLGQLGSHLETYFRVYPPREGKREILELAAAAYQAGEWTQAEWQVLLRLREQHGLSGPLLERYFKLLRASDPAGIVSIAGTESSSSLRTAATAFAVASGDPDLALRAVAARGQTLQPVWTPAYTGLVGLHYSVLSPEINAAFLTALGGSTIGERVGKPVEREEQLAGDIWFYYGSRYGEYLDLSKQGDPDDYLPAELEHTPARPSAYFELAEYFREKRVAARALAEYEHTLELDKNRGDAHDRAAAVLWEEGKREEAVARWREALKAYSRQQDAGPIPEVFWTDVRDTLESIGRRQLLPSMREETDRLLRTYVRRNGSYRVEPLLRGTLAAVGDPAGGVEWIVDLAGAAPDPLDFLSEIVEAPWLPETQREVVLQRILALAREQLFRSHGDAKSYAEQRLGEWEVRWINYLTERRQNERARAALESLPETTRQLFADRVASLEIRLAARTGSLEALLVRYQQESETAAADEILRETGTALREEVDDASARRVLDFLYTRALEQRRFHLSSFLGLAELRLEEGDLAGAMALLNRMTLVGGEPFEGLEPAAALLEKTGHSAEAAKFRAAWVKVTPWDAGARVRWARALLNQGSQREEALALLTEAAGDPKATYETRVAAALLFRRRGARSVNAGSAELDLLASGRSLEIAAVEQPFFYAARLEAARETQEAGGRQRLLLDAVAIEPDASEPRLPLLRAALETKHYALGVAAVTPLLESSGLQYQLQRAEALDDENQAALRVDQYAIDRFLFLADFTREQRAAAARDLAEAFEQLNCPGAAELLLRISIGLETSEKERNQLEHRIKVLASAHSLRRANALRRPAIREELEQDRIVRPRLTEAPTESEGEEQ